MSNIEYQANYFRHCGKACPIYQIEEMLTKKKIRFKKILEFIESKGLDIVSQSDDEVLALCNKKIATSVLRSDAYASCGYLTVSNNKS